MKIKIVIALLILAGLGASLVWWKQGNKVSIPNPITNQAVDLKSADIAAIRDFMANPSLELSFVNTNLPMPYFRVGKVTKIGNGENMEAVDGWTRQVNVYDQKDLLNGQCVVYEYHTDVRNHNLTAVVIRGLRPNEIEARKQDGVTCVQSSPSTKISKGEAETVAWEYLSRALPNFDQIKNQFVYSQQYNGESHQWFWEDKSYKLPDGLEGRPYSYPTIHISVSGNKQIQYWNTVSLFEN